MRFRRTDYIMYGYNNNDDLRNKINYLYRNVDKE